MFIKNNPVLTGILTGIIGSIVFTPIGGIAIGFLAWHMCKKESDK